MRVVSACPGVTLIKKIYLLFLPFLHPNRPGYRAERELQDHIQAEDYGRSFGNCWSAFPECPVSMREMLYEFFLNNSD
ncbi:hypothetical protein SK128_010895, partial [Halocaridina rubra]